MSGTEISAVRRRMLAGLDAALHLVFPPRCLCCGEAVGSDQGLCGPCWRDAGFIQGACCTRCGTPLPGQSDEALCCDECLADPPPWRQGRAALTYSETGRRLVLQLKHGDRLDLVRPLAGWMARAGAPLIGPDSILAPVPLHRLRMLKRRYNQSALLAQEIARQTGSIYVPDLFRRVRATPSQEGRSREERAANLSGAIGITNGKETVISGSRLMIIDDVITSGATLRAVAEAAISANAACVDVLLLARVARNT
ncbi:ComF family protein [Pseudothioclava arenosa]|nr:ComF family protein [Pseudothioclava arenosa]